MTAGSRLASALSDRYRVERELGQGGMATVYLAEDLKHGRKVAIKVLHPELTAVIGADRFLTEIRTTANLQHPHILPLFDSGAVGATADAGPTTHDSRLLFYVMPYVDGETLRARLTREKQLPVSDALRIASEVASALDYAHRRGVIHRDIKPENILLHDGQAMVADFGIAIAVQSAGGTRLTETGMSLGTPNYMSPEQAMGEREITARSDVYALGAVTYEMLLGEPPFSGPTAQAIIAKVMTAEPSSLVAQRRSIPTQVSDAVLTALEKVPADRFATAADFAAALSGSDPARTRPARIRSGPGRSRPWLGRAIGAVALVLGVAAAAWTAGRGARASLRAVPPARLALVAPALGASTLSTGSRQVAVSRTGDAVMYVGVRDSTTAFFLQRLDAPAPVEVPGSAGLREPILTPDGRGVVGTSPEGVVWLPLEGGQPRPVALPTTSLNGAWAPDGSYWFNTIGVEGLFRWTTTDSIVPLPLPRERQTGLRVQQVLEDGRTALVIAATTVTNAGPLALLDLNSGTVTRLLDGPVFEARIVLGELVCVLPAGEITAAPFDLHRRRFLGPAVALGANVATGNPIASFALADNGTLVFIQEREPSLVLVGLDGREQEVLREQPNLHAPRYSPDGRTVAFDLTENDERDVWILDLEQRVRSRVTYDRDGHDPTWTPDGRFITYSHFVNELPGLYRARPGSTAPGESLLASPMLGYTGAWLPDGSALITNGIDLQGNSGVDIARIANAGRGPIEAVQASPYLERYAAPSPSGKLVAFTSDQTGREEVYVLALDGEGAQVQVSREGGTEPAWAPGGRVLYYRSSSGSGLPLMAATLVTTPRLGVSSQRALFATASWVGSGPHANYDISPDGRRFAVVHRSTERHIVVIQDLPGLLRKLRATNVR